MTSPDNKPASKTASEDARFDSVRVAQLLAQLEQELASMPPDTPHLDKLRNELGALKAALPPSGPRQAAVGERAHSLRASLQNMTATVEGEVLKDSPYIAELGRILGMV